MVRICLYVHICLAPPMIVSAWLMAVVLCSMMTGVFLKMGMHLTIIVSLSVTAVSGGVHCRLAVQEARTACTSGSFA